jgi:prepilin-type N-terminal cleavage/methylation domain-containing protein
MYLKALRQRGDTIIEVMIVLAVLGLAISIAYATANRSLLNTRQAQESSRGAALAQSQIEQLRALSPNKIPSETDKYIYRAGDFCIDASGKVVPYTVAACTYDSATAVPYDVKINYTTSAGINTFKVVITWADVLGEGNDTTTFLYRVYQPRT